MKGDSKNMKVIISKKDFENAITIAKSAVSLKTPIPILSHFLLNASEGRLKISATDLEIGIECSIPANIIEEGSFTTPAKTLSDIISLLPDCELTLNKENEELEVSSESCNYKFLTLSADEFPVIPHSIESADIIIKQKKMREMTRNVVFAAASQEETRAVLTGILAILSGKNIEFVATDGRRLAKMKCVIDTESMKDTRFVIPSRILLEMSKFMKDPESNINISIKGGQIFFHIGEIFVMSRMLDGKYPQYSQVIPEKTNRKFVMGRHRILQSLKRALIMAQEKQNPSLVKISVQKDRLIIRTNTPDLGSAYEEIPILLDGDPIDIAFNGIYVIDALINIQDESLVFEMTSSEGPCVIHPEGNDEYIYVVMPVRIKERSSLPEDDEI